MLNISAVIMKKLFLVRHGKSSWDFPELEDFDRPLNKRGNKDAPLMGKILAKKDITPDFIYSSPANRALKTALIIADNIIYNKPIQVLNSIYHAGENTLWNLVKEQPNDVNSIMIFGHNPEFTSFANTLTSNTIDNLPTSGVYAVSWQVDHWDEIRKKEGQLLFFDFPKNHK